MRKFVVSSALAVVLIGSAAAVVAQMPPPPGKKDPALVTAGTYALEPGHTQVFFSYRHFGLTDNMGVISGDTSGTGSLTIDPKSPSAAKVSVELPVKTIRTTIAKLDEEFLSEKFFDVAKFPTAKFVSTGVKADGNNAEISGDLTIHGVTKPVVLSAAFDAAGVNPFSKKLTVSFNGTTTIKRSDFGIGAAVPLVGDEVELKIVAAFEKQ